MRITNFGRKEFLILLAALMLVAIGLLLVFAEVDGASAVGGFLISIGTLFAQKLSTAFDFEFGASRRAEPPSNAPNQ